MSPRIQHFRLQAQWYLNGSNLDKDLQTFHPKNMWAPFVLAELAIYGRAAPKTLNPSTLHPLSDWAAPFYVVQEANVDRKNLSQESINFISAAESIQGVHPEIRPTMKGSAVAIPVTVLQGIAVATELGMLLKHSKAQKLFKSQYFVRPGSCFIFVQIAA